MINRKNNLFNRIVHDRKNKTLSILFKAVSAYSFTDYKNFAFEGWICLIINSKPVFFRRIRDKSLNWYVFGWDKIFKKNWKYIGLNKEDYICSWPITTWYIMNYDFINRVVKVKEI